MCPVVGHLVDKIGKRVIMIIAAALMVTFAHILFAVTPDSFRPVYPIFYLVILGFAYSVYVTVY